MATITKLFTWVSDYQSWGVGIPSPANLLQEWDSTDGNPAGCLHAYVDPSSSAGGNLGFFQYNGTWESLGVPAGSTVTAIRLDAGYDRANVYASGLTIGPYALYQSTTLKATLKASRTPTATESSWVSVGTQADQAIESAMQPSTTVVRLRIYANVPGGTSASVRFDQVQYVITYTAPPAYAGTLTKTVGNATFTASASFSIPTYNGSLAQSATHATFAASGSRVVPVYTGSLSKSATHSTLTSASTATALYTGSSTKTISHPTISAAASSSAPVYHGSLSKSSTHATFTASASFIIPVYTGSLTKSATHVTFTSVANVNKRLGVGSVTASHATIQAFASFVIPVYTGSATLTASKSFTASATFKPQTFTGNAALTSSHATLVATGLVGLKASLVTQGWGYNQNILRRNYYSSKSYTGTLIVTINHPIIASSAHFAIPVYTANLAVTATHATISSSSHEAAIYTGNLSVSKSASLTTASGVFVKPVYTGTLVKSATHVNMSASALFVTVVYTGSLAKSTTHATITAAASFVLPVYHGSSTLTKHPTLTSASSFVIPVYTGSASLSRHPTFFSSAGDTTPNYSATSSLSASHTITSTGSLVVPFYHGTMSRTTNNATFFAAGVGIVPIYHGDAILSKRATFIANSTGGIPQYTANATVTINHPTMASINRPNTIASLVTQGWGYGQRILSRYYSQPNPGGTSSLARSATFTASGVRTLPSYSGSLTASSTHATMASTATTGNVLANYSGTLVKSATHAVLSGSGTLVVQVYTGNSTLSKHPFMSSSGHWQGLPVFGSSGLLKIPTFSGTGVFFIPVRMAFCNVTSTDATLASSGTFTISPQVLSRTLFIKNKMETAPKITTKTNMVLTVLHSIVDEPTLSGGGPCQHKPSF